MWVKMTHTLKNCEYKENELLVNGVRSRCDFTLNVFNAI